MREPMCCANFLFLVCFCTSDMIMQVLVALNGTVVGLCVSGEAAKNAAVDDASVSESTRKGPLSVQKTNLVSCM